ncbi:hypothetical protein BC749_1089 [Flavobacterium araucananum]|uniref:Histidine kinase domain-containing protein n=1 Tax=Flavobacterium araucananum TaxID=946678 RepID=A0A227P5Q8_9FLAO|nr:ATP-binding protein [Flavobacterium araucananum]OXG04526.1 hypothetical protein B0A64_15180 [Flavobacterium araucananum]PWJ96873.1 hypothetical protein BC749_1089 [Flavobacterium araucananum]
MTKKANPSTKIGFIKQFLLVFLLSGITLVVQSCEKNLKLKHHKPDNAAAIKILVDKADVLFDSNHYDSAYYYFNKAQLLCDKEVNYIDYVYSITCMASIEQNEGDYTASELSLTKTFPYLKKIVKPRFTANVYEQLAANYYYTYDYNNSLYYLIKALHLKTSYYRKSSVLNTISIVYMGQKRYKEALAILIPLSKIKILCKADKDVDANERARVIENIGLCYLNQENPKSIFYFKKSLKMKLLLKEDDLLVYNYRHLSSYYNKNNNYKLAKEYGKKAYDLATRINLATNRIESLSLLIKASEGNDLKKYSSLYIDLTDSLFTAQQTTKNQFSRIKYDSKNERAENLQLKAQKAENDLQLERQKSRNIILYVVILFILGFITFLYFHLKAKGRKEKDLAVFESEMRISKKLSNELTNDLRNTLLFAGNIDLSTNKNKEKLLNNLDSLYSRTRNISKENSPVVTNENYSLALKEMISGFKTPDINLLLNGLEIISFDKTEKNKKITIYRVIQELLINMQKHSNASLVGISFKKRDKSILLTYNDNGQGIDLEKISSKSGLKNIENRILNIRGEINIDSSSGKGLKVFIKFPL